MTEILITSSVLILALLTLREAFRRSLSRRMQYALWALVLVRLLVPVHLPGAVFSVLTSTRPVEQSVSQRLEAQPVYVPVARAPLAEHPSAPDLAPERMEISAGESVWVVDTDETAVQYKRLSVETLLSTLWIAGMILAAGFFLAANLRFWLGLRRRRTPYPVEHCARRVYLVEDGLASPCLFGLFRPAIYLTPAAVSAPERLEHVIAHEETHARHLDSLWALLRCVCLAVYWFDPLVWIAAAVSKSDCELACDEGALVRLGEDARISYGQTLLSLIPIRKAPGNPLLTATTMTAGKRQLKDRITRIAQKPRRAAAAAVIAAILAGVAAACTFTGARVRPAEPTPTSIPAQADAIVQDWGAPERTLSLDNAALWTPEAYPILETKLGWDGQAEVYREGTIYELVILTSYEEETQYFAVVDRRLNSLQYRCFLALPLGEGKGFIGGGGFPEGLFGYDGPVDAITYRDASGTLLTDYVCVAEDGTPVRLVQAVSDMPDTFHIDCDGDGNAEVVAPNQFFFQRGNQVYQANIPALWAEAYPEHILDWSRWNVDTMLTASGHVQGADGVTRTWTRYLRYDGENFLVYKDPRTCEDHVMSNIRAPEAVVDQAKELALEWMPPSDRTDPLETAEYDDWRVESISGPTELQVGGITLHAYSFNYEYHTTTPAEVVIAGGRYITEDDWVMLGYPNCDYLFFREEEDGTLTFLWHELSNDMGPELLAEQGLRRLGLLDADPAYLVQRLWDEITDRDNQDASFALSLTPADGVGGGTYTSDISRGYNMPWDITVEFRWDVVEEAEPADLADTSVLSVSGGGNSLTFYQKPRLVEYQRNGDHRWFRAELRAERDDVFLCELFESVRQWYDEIEGDALSAGIVIPDDGRSYEALAQAWIEQYEGAHLLATSGSKHRWTYLDVRDVSVDTELERSNYPAYIGDREAFRFWYSAVFVPENQDALNWSMAGNTMNYEGEDAPENAFQWWRLGWLYLDEDGWRCDGTFTG